ncbi:MAG: DUF3365 domain-containing protein [Deltaproteobacteria bacterium]|nr:DUF3365 domain-containing protein [Deltaproteobacteria bacterium]
MSPRQRLTSIILVFNLFWTLVLAGLTVVSILQEKKTSRALAEIEARASFDKDIIYRRWVAVQGGVYAPIATTPPNPYLGHLQDRDLTSTAGHRLTLINPAYMSRQVHAMSERQHGFVGHITSLKPLRPENLPDPWERSALERFNADLMEISSVENIGPVPYLRYMKALLVEESCLKCHADQGYMVGDIRGGISVSVPMAPYQAVGDANIRRHCLTYFLLWAFGLIFFNYFLFLLRNEIKGKESIEKALQVSEEKFAKAFHNHFLLMMISDLESGVIYDVNETFVSLTGFSKEQAVGRTAAELGLCDASHRERIKTELERKSDIEDLETQITKADGSAATCLFFHEAIEVDGKPRLLSIAQDITDRKKAEEEKKLLFKQLQQSQKLEAIGVLAGGIAHDFNNILSAIMGYTELTILNHEDDPRLTEDLENVMRAGARAKELVNQILTFSRQSRNEKFPLQLQPIIKEAVKMLRSTLPATITIDESIAGDCGAVLADPTQIHQILVNLCTNAFHAMEKGGGRLKVCLQRAASLPAALLEQVPADGEFLELSVSDTGCGIEEKFLQKIFDPFFTTKEQGKGTGMGLSITHGIVKEHGGAILIDSIIDRGTTFKVYLPEYSRPTAMQASAPAAETALPGGDEHILIVDDDKMVAEAMQAMLTRLGYRTTAVLDSNQAWRLFREHSQDFDLVITDLTMPGLTGIELAEKINELGLKLPVILCSGYNYLSDDKAMSRIGIRAVIKKPVNIAVLAEIMRQVLDRAA